MGLNLDDLAELGALEQRMENEDGEGDHFDNMDAIADNGDAAGNGGASDASDGQPHLPGKQLTSDFDFFAQRSNSGFMTESDESVEV